MGLGCLGVGMLWGLEFPIIKNLWTSTFVLVAGGWSLLLLALFYTIIDVLKLCLGVRLRRDRRQRDHDLHGRLASSIFSWIVGGRLLLSAPIEAAPVALLGPVWSIGG